MFDAPKDFTLVSVQLFKVVTAQSPLIKHVFQGAFLQKRVKCLIWQVLVPLVFQLTTHIKSDQNLSFK